MTTAIAEIPLNSGECLSDQELEGMSETPADLPGMRNSHEKPCDVESHMARQWAWSNLAAEICQAQELRSAFQLAASSLQEQLRGARVAIGLRRGIRANVRLIALSDVARFSLRTELVRSLEAAMDEVALKKAMVIWSAGEAVDGQAAPAHRRLSAAMENATIVTVPLIDPQGDCWGAIVFIGLALPASLEAIHGFTQDGGATVRAALNLWRRHSTRWSARLAKVVWGASARKRTAVVATAIALLTGILSLPVPYRISCDCEVQPVARRFVVAPFDGVLEESLAAPGDRVRTGQVLARLDGREIRCELAGLQSDYERKNKERDTALATGQTSGAQIARLEMERLELKINLLQQREQDLEIQSPTDGILITGDWQRARGARITVGQSLFEIGPLDRMIVEVAVPEDDVSFARPGTPVRLQVNSAEASALAGVLELVHPRAEIQNDRNVFVAEVTLDNAEGVLLPGMKGTAKIRGPCRPLAWNLFHKPWYAVRRWFGL